MRTKPILSILPLATIVLFSHAARASDYICNGNYNCSTETEITYSGSADGLYVSTSSSGVNGISGHTAGTGAGVFGENTTDNGYGVQGKNNSADGVAIYGSSSGAAGYGVDGTSTGNSGVGVYAYASGSSAYGVYAEADPSGSIALYGKSTSGDAIYADGNAAVTGALSVGGNVVISGNLQVDGGCTGCSDLRLKKNVKPLVGALDQLLQLKEVTFEWIDPTKHHHERETGTQVGFIAQDVEKVHPEWVNPEGYKSKDGETFRTIDLHEIEALEVGGMRELKAKNDALEERLRGSESKNDKQQAQIDKLERRLDTLTNGRDPISGGPGFGTGTLALMGLGLGGFAGFSRLSRRKREESETQS